MSFSASETAGGTLYRMGVSSYLMLGAVGGLGEVPGDTTEMHARSRMLARHQKKHPLSGPGDAEGRGAAEGGG